MDPTRTTRLPEAASRTERTSECGARQRASRSIPDRSARSESVAAWLCCLHVFCTNLVCSTRYIWYTNTVGVSRLSRGKCSPRRAGPFSSSRCPRGATPSDPAPSGGRATAAAPSVRAARARPRRRRCPRRRSARLVSTGTGTGTGWFVCLISCWYYLAGRRCTYTVCTVLLALLQ